MKLSQAVLALGFLARLAAQMIVTGGTEYYAAPGGSSSGSGTMSDPWDLATALAQPPRVRPGDIIWLRGGRYGSGGATVFVSTLAGSREKPIVVRQYPGERAVIDGGIRAEGRHTWFWGFEIANSSPVRIGAADKVRPVGLDLLGRNGGMKAINLVVHDTGHPGIGFWNQSDDGEIYGCIVWGNGVYDTETRPGTPEQPWIRGSGVYAQNTTGTAYISDSIWFRNFTTGINAYAEGGGVKGFYANGNISFDNAQDDLWFATAPVRDPNPIERLAVIGNYTYRRSESAYGALQVGYRGDNNDAIVKDNYLVGGNYGAAALLLLRKFSDKTVTGNTVVGAGVLVQANLRTPPGAVVWDNNRYYGGSRARGGTPFHFTDNGKRLDVFERFEEWKTISGFDAGSTFSPTQPAETVAFVRPNKYESGRAHIAVYNWALLDEAPVDVSKVLEPGMTYELYDVQNLAGGPVAAGAYDGSPIAAPMKSGQAEKLAGTITHFKPSHTAPWFGAFLLVGKAPEKAESVPAIDARGVVNAANPQGGDAALAAGSLVSVFGENFSRTTAAAESAPLPYVLGGTMVYLGGAALPLLYVSPGQINAQLPAGLEPGGELPFRVVYRGQTSAPAMVRTASAAPGILAVEPSGGRPGDSIAIYSTGLGDVQPAVDAGKPAPWSTPARTVNEPEVTIGGVAVPVSFAGLMPLFAGLYRIDAAVPLSAAPGTADVRIFSGGSASNSVSIVIEAAREK